MTSLPYPLYRRLSRDPISPAEIFDRFLDYVAERGLTLYPAQETAMLELFEGKNVILNTPTGSGKSLVATALHFLSICRGRRSVYTCPIKALVNEKFLALCRDFGPEQVGMSTGDASVNRDAPILCCTAEILHNLALREGPRTPVDEVVMDEFHYYADRERGVAWQTPMLTLPQARFLLMSATLGDTAFFEEELTRLTGAETVTVKSSDRPVPLEFKYVETLLERTLEDLVAAGQAPVYIVHFTQLEAAQNAQNFTSLNFCTREEKAQLAEATAGFKFTSPYGPDIRKWARHGIGIHHAGLLPKYRVLIEQLAQKGLLKIICGTDTLGVGINVPIRTVLFTKLCKYDAQKTGILSARDFHQISGRAGRKGFDTRGWVVAQAPEHIIENLHLEQKCAGDAKKMRKIVKRKPPEKNFVAWDKNTFARLIVSPPERLISRFQVTHGMVLNVLSRPGNACAVFRSLIQNSHETPAAKRQHGRRAWQLFRSLIDRKIIEFIPPTPEGTYLRVNVQLQDDFSLDQTLSLYLIDTLFLLDPNAPDYALDLLTLVESILEDPDIILRKQLDRLKTQKMAEMKMEGLDYNERMEELEKLEHPKPKRDFIYSTFNDFADRHPWVGTENIRPKSIAREMFENFQSFADFIRGYELQRAEGILLRHLSSVYKTLVQTVPDSAKTEAVREIEVYLSAMLHQVDSSLLDEWERLRNPNYIPRVDREEGASAAAELPPDITRDAPAFTVLVRNQIFVGLRALAVRDFEAALDILANSNDETGQPWTPERLAKILDDYGVEHARICLDPNARNTRHTYVQRGDDPKIWRVDQVLVDPDGHNDWQLSLAVDLPRSRETGQPALRLLRFGPVGGGGS